MKNKKLKLLLLVIILLVISNIMQIMYNRILQKDFLSMKEIISEKEEEIVKLQEELEICQNVQTNFENDKNTMTFLALVKNVQLSKKEILVEGIGENDSLYKGEFKIRVDSDTKIITKGKRVDTSYLIEGQLIKVYCTGVSLSINPPIIIDVTEIEIMEE